ncbi:MAG: hypothetical protein M3N14_05750 [Bacteroidota bacterium]|nr:hypothetical protein [Bacteroidota bacterium]
MEIKLEIPDYDKTTGLRSHWEDGFEIDVKELNGEILISANRAGLISLAIQLLTLAQDTVPPGHHFYFDDYNSLEEGSNKLIIQKV